MFLFESVIVRSIKIDNYLDAEVAGKQQEVSRADKGVERSEKERNRNMFFAEYIIMYIKLTWPSLRYFQIPKNYRVKYRKDRRGGRDGKSPLPHCMNGGSRADGWG